MIDRQSIGQRVRQHYEGVWRAGDAWDLESSAFEQERYAHQLDLLLPRRYARVLEIGCGSGRFTRLLAGVADRVVALDIADAAIERARNQLIANEGCDVEFIVANAMEYDLHAQAPWDLVVLSETIYCLGWLYSFFDVAWFAAQLFESTRAGGRLLLANTYGHERDFLMRPWLIRTYRDLFLNIGYELEREEMFDGVKEGIAFEALMSLYAKPPQQRGQG